MKYPYAYLLLLYLNFLPCPTYTATAVNHKIDKDVFYLEPGEIAEKLLPRSRGYFDNNLNIYCYGGANKTLRKMFESIELQLEINSDDYTQYEGESPELVRQHYEEKQSLFSFSLFSQKRTRLSLSPFLPQCIGIESNVPYRVILHQTPVDLWRFIFLVCGLIIFIYAGVLSRNSLFYYITGIIFGICSSFMLIIWLGSKLIPRRPMMYGVLIGGWSIGIYILQLLWENMQVIMITYRTYVFWYIFITGVLSFFFCYRMGPPINERSKNIIKWILQIISLLAVYFSSHFEEASLAIIICTLIGYYFPRALIHKMYGVYIKQFPPKRRLLTNDEYYEQGVRETTKALEELRAFASSPECKQWKVMRKLQDPMRFATFVDGASHLRDEEILSFESSQYADELHITDSSSENEMDGYEHEEEIRSNHSYSRHHISNLRSTPIQTSVHRGNSLRLVTAEEMSDSEESEIDENINLIANSFSNTQNGRFQNIGNRSRNRIMPELLEISSTTSSNISSGLRNIKTTPHNNTSSIPYTNNRSAHLVNSTRNNSRRDGSNKRTIR